ncbi:DUF4374 domain-containing protein [Chitinophaga japonensis]|uniref:Uncharacterized protein DUF4374 n=1 Tax=Chitinophaga japonensis TaxID=104662 RepID=A0A562TGR0_CHIJA|nr:DUF4374 domain-containing protein [Chitinophaga japonensis]TWI92368.1 uncharacterized protein DUF4374 [Chitinophaga japonensis]
MRSLYYLPALVLLLAVTGCYKPKSFPRATAGNYIVALRTNGPSGTSDYLLTVDGIDNDSTVISAAGNGIEQLGWCYFSATANAAFSFNYGSPNIGTAYGISGSNGLTEKGSFSFDRMDCFATADASSLIAIGAPWGGGSYDCEIHVVDDISVGIVKRKISPLYRMSANDTLNKWPSSIVVNDGKMYVSFYPLEGVSWETAETDTAFVSIYTYPGLDSLTTIKDTRTGPIGYYGNPVSMVKAENGDIYTISPNSYAAGYTQVTKPSGILRIRNGQLQFDDSYFFDVEAATGGGKLLSAHYAGNGLLVGQMVIPGEDTQTNLWGALTPTTPICKLVVVDVYNKTVTDVSGVPLHGGQFSTPAFVEEGLVYFSITSTVAGEARVYVVDPVTATAKKGAKIEGVELPGIFKVAK